MAKKSVKILGSVRVTSQAHEATPRCRPRRSFRFALILVLILSVFLSWQVDKVSFPWLEIHLSIIFLTELQLPLEVDDAVTDNLLHGSDVTEGGGIERHIDGRTGTPSLWDIVVVSGCFCGGGSADSIDSTNNWSPEPGTAADVVSSNVDTFL